ncbi:MAG: (2Fe-2S)-binding protein [Actinomycetota bacterium]
MANGTAAAIILADTILRRSNPWAHLFDPHRVTVLPSASKFVTENAKVAAHWIRDRITHPQSKPFEDLQAGEASVRGQGLNPTAGYRDEGGQLHVVSAVCTHLACIVTWNSAEKTWDCPCHGSRFDYEGQVIQGPAVTDLAKKDYSP